MTEILLALVVLALVVYGLERNHQRHLRLGSPLSGSTDVEDRDLPRLQVELQATAAHTGAAGHLRAAALTDAAAPTPSLLTLRQPSPRSGQRTWPRSARPASQPYPRP